MLGFFLRFALIRLSIRSFIRLALLAGAIALAKKAFDKWSAQSAPAPSPAPAPAPSAAPEPIRATAPPDTPGPSVTPPGQGSETERAETAETTVPQPPPDDDPLVAEEEAAAAAEAAAIGGPRLHDADDPAFEAAYEAGEGESEGFEIAERELEENATHGGGRADPLRDAFTPELEADEQTAVDGEADEILDPDEDRKEA
jgi:hypothetical protein